MPHNSSLSIDARAHSGAPSKIYETILFTVCLWGDGS